MSAELARVVRGYLDHLAVERALAGNTLASYRRDLRRYREWLAASGIDTLSSVSPAQVSQFLTWLREGDHEHLALSASSAARTVSAVRGLHRFAVREGLTEAAPSAEVRPPVPARRLPRALQVAEVTRLLEA
ncbi:MAG: site-specific integrase, partial [Actinocatenispora sp.]